jgi:sugar lactone lactonase YvrE
MEKNQFVLSQSNESQSAQHRIRINQWKNLWLGLAVLALLLAGFQPVLAREVFPPVIPLPVGFQPEGIAVGKGTTFYVGSIPTGAIYRGDLRTGEGSILVPEQEGRSAIGLAYDERSGYLFVAGGMTGEAYVYDGSTGETVAVFTLTTEESVFINDVVVTREAAYFTNSFLAEIYRIPLGPAGRLPGQDAVQTIGLGGDYVQSPGFNANGIDATPNGKWLVIVNSGQGALYRVNPQTGFATRIDLGGATLPFGDGILLDGRILYVVQNRLNQIAVVWLAPDLTSGEVRATISDDDFRVPTTIAEFGRYLYAVNARFGVDNPEAADFEVVQVEKYR